jgi:hypothetical protein
VQAQAQAHALELEHGVLGVRLFLVHKINWDRLPIYNPNKKEMKREREKQSERQRERQAGMSCFVESFATILVSPRLKKRSVLTHAGTHISRAHTLKHSHPLTPARIVVTLFIINSY